MSEAKTISLEVKDSLGIDDIVAIRVADVEAKLLKTVEDSRREVKELGKSLDAKGKELKALQDATAKKLLGADAKRVEKALNTLWPDEEHPIVYVVVRDTLKSGKRCYYCALSVLGVSPTVQVRKDCPDKAVVAMEALRDELEGLEKAKNEAAQKGLVAKESLTKLPALERQTRAALVKDHVARAANGAEMLSLIGAATLPGIESA